MSEEEWKPVEEPGIEEDLGFDIVPDEEEDLEEGSIQEEEEKKISAQERIDQLTREKHEERRLREEVEGKLEEVSSRLNNLEKGHEKTSVEEFKKDYESTRAKLAKAIEDGDTEGQIVLNEKLSDMRTAARMAQTRKPVEEAPRTPAGTPPAKALAWWRKNPWFNTNTYAKETDIARSIDRQLEAEGFDKNSDDYYNELDNRLQEEFPELYSKKRTTKTDVAPGNSGKSEVGKSKGGRVRMTQSQVSAAQQLGLDLSDPDVRKAYLAELQSQRES